MGRRIIGGAFVSVDGVMQAPGRPEEDSTGGFTQGDWLATMFDEALGNLVDTRRSSWVTASACSGMVRP